MGFLGAGIAALQGNLALAGAAGGEYAANTIREHLYNNRNVNDLTESEKQNISNWSQVQVVSGVTVGAASAATFAINLFSEETLSDENNKNNNLDNKAPIQLNNSSTSSALGGLSPDDENDKKQSNASKNKDKQQQSNDFVNYKVS